MKFVFKRISLTILSFLYVSLLYGVAPLADTVFVRNDIDLAIQEAKEGKFIAFGFFDQQFETLPKKFLEIPAEKLVFFIWDNCKAKELPEDFSKYKNIYSLELNWYYGEEAAIKEFPGVICSLTGLKSLILHGFGFSTIPLALKNLSGLERLEINASNINSFPEVILSLNNLKKLSLACNKNLTSVPEKIAVLQKLEVLEFDGGACGGSPIKGLPESIGELKNLRKISLGNAKLDGLPNSFCRLKNLESLSMLFSTIKNFPEDIGNLSNLKEINISAENELEAFPETFFRLTLSSFSLIVNNPSISIREQANKIRQWGNGIKNFEFYLFGENSEHSSDEELSNLFQPISDESPIIGIWEYKPKEKESITLNNITLDSVDYEMSGEILMINSGSEKSTLVLSYWPDEELFPGPTDFTTLTNGKTMKCVQTSSLYVVLGEMLNEKNGAFEFDYIYNETADELTITTNKNETYTFQRFDKERYALTAEEYFKMGEKKLLELDFEGAISYYDKAIERKPAYALAYCSRAYTKRKQGLKNEALLDLNMAIKINPTLEVAYDERAYLKLILKDEEGALQDLTKLIELNPSKSKYYFKRGVLRFNTLDFKNCTTDLNKAIELEPNPQIYFYRAVAQIELKNYSPAIADLNKVIEADPKHGRAYLYRGKAKYELEDYEGSIADLTIQIDLYKEKKWGELYLTRALVKFALGQTESGCQDLKEASDLGELVSKELKKNCK